MKDALVQYSKSNLTNEWLGCTAGGMYVRQGAYHCIDMTHGGVCTFDFGSVFINDEYAGQGIMMEVIDWWHTQHLYPYTYIESLQNEEFMKKLHRNGWEFVPVAFGTSMYKSTGK